MMDMGIKHNKTLDVAKGIAIILVVLGHSFPNNIFNGYTNVDIMAKIIYDFVYSFHMPIFFTIAGYFFFNAWRQHKKGTLAKKAMRLLIPYLSFSIIYIPLRMFASSLANSDFEKQYWKILIGISPNGGVWFLFILFLFFSITFYLVNLNNIKVVLIITLICSFIFNLGLPFTQHLHDVAPRLLDICRFYFYFILGLYININISFRRLLNTRFVYLETILFLALYLIDKLCKISIFVVPIAVLGIHLTVLLSQKLENSKLLSWCGVNSMDIYLLHGPIMIVMRTIFLKVGLNKICIAIGLFGGSILFAMVISKLIIHKIKIIEFLCTGIWRKA